MYRTPLYALFFVVLTIALWLQKTYPTFEAYSLVAVVVTHFTVVHALRLIQLNAELVNEPFDPTGSATSFLEHLRTGTVMSVNFCYVLASVVVLWNMNYSGLSLLLLGSFTVTLTLYKLCDATVNNKDRSTI